MLLPLALIVCLIVPCFHPISLGATTYAQAGVSDQKGDLLVDRIAPLAKSTARPGTNGILGGFSSTFDLACIHYEDPIILSTTDGVGTKLKLAIAFSKHDTIGIDLVAMCVNDLIVHGGEPVMFLDYFAAAHLDVAHATRVIAGIAQGCKQAGCTLAGGETAQLPGMYHGSDYDLAGFAIGIAERSQLLPRCDRIKPGDVVIGLASSGIHSNGYSLVRYVLEKNNIDIFAKPPFASDCTTLADVLLEPTIIYVQSLLPLIHDGYLKALAHITGGGLPGNIPRVLPESCAVHLDAQAWDIPPVFAWLAHIGDIGADEMFATFNMGIGMVAIVAQEDAAHVIQRLQQAGQKAGIIGCVVPVGNDNQQVIIGYPEIHR
jgi:phosphoribosylformylglycinamidine cyclo-ligase